MRRILLLGLLLVSVAGSQSARTTAYFTSTSTSAANTFTAATIQLGANPTSAIVSFSNTYPGKDVYGSVTVQNSGTGTLRYSIADTATNADGKGLAGALQLTVATGGAGTCDAGGFGSYASTLYAAAALANTDGTTLNLVGDPTSGQQAGDRTLAPSASEALCFKVSLPTNASTALQSATTTVTFTFSSQQVSGT